MGGGGLRILGHKKWHVWRRENIERVDRDEQQHAQQQQQLLLDQRGVEQERRVHALQQQSTSGEGRGRARDDIAAVAEHINFFKHEQEEREQQVALLAANEAAVGTNGREHKGSRRVQRQQQDTLGQQGHVPWYAKAFGAGDAAGVGEPRATKPRGEQKRKRALEDQDPLKHMRPRRSSSSASSPPDERDCKRSRDAEERTERVYTSDFSRLASRSNSSRDGSKEDQMKSRHDYTASALEPTEKQPKSHKKHSKHREKESVLQQLRREREEREARERQRADALMRGR